MELSESNMKTPLFGYFFFRFMELSALQSHRSQLLEAPISWIPTSSIFHFVKRLPVESLILSTLAAGNVCNSPAQSSLVPR